MRQKTLATVMALAALGLGVVSDVPAQPIAAGGKTSQAAYDCPAFDADGKATVTVTLPRGVAKRLLVIQAHARGFGVGSPCEIALDADVGASNPYGGSASGREGVLYTANGSWWADFDELEAEAPGSFVGMPVVVTLNAFKGSGSTCSGVCASLSTQLVRK